MAEPQKIANILADLLARRGFGRVQSTEAYERRGGRRPGPLAGQYTRIGALRRGTLEVVVLNSTLVQELTYQKAALLKALNQLLPGAGDPRSAFPLGSDHLAAQCARWNEAVFRSQTDLCHKPIASASSSGRCSTTPHRRTAEFGRAIFTRRLTQFAGFMQINRAERKYRLPLQVSRNRSIWHRLCSHKERLLHDGRWLFKAAMEFVRCVAMGETTRTACVARARRSRSFFRTGIVATARLAIISNCVRRNW